MYVLLPWLSTIGLKLQSILLSGLRSPDVKSSNVKKCVRWLRGQCQHNGDPNKQDYMESINMTEELIWNAMEELQYLAVHFVHHFADAFAVVAYHHPNENVRNYSYTIHNLVAVELFHFKPETKEEFLKRHADYKTSSEETKEQIESKRRSVQEELDPGNRSY